MSSFQSQLYIALLCFVYGTSLVHTLVAEIPIVNLEKILLEGNLVIYEAKHNLFLNDHAIRIAWAQKEWGIHKTARNAENRAS